MKMKIIVVVFAIFSCLHTNAQEEFNRENANGERIGKWQKFHENGRMRYRGQFKNGKEVGVFKYYSIVSSDHPIVIKTFSEDSDIAQVEFYTEKGILESNGKMEGKNRVGTWYYYHADGMGILSEENYKNGQLNGVSKTYYKTGKITEEMNYKNGLLDGNLKRYADNGVLIDDVIYVDGKLNGLAKYYDLKGNLIYTGPYENDERVGKWEFYIEGELADPAEIKQE